MSVRIRISAKLETSDHDGYCSGGECEYECKEVVHEYDLQNGDVTDIDLADYAKFLPFPIIDTGGSGYCGVSSRCSRAGLAKHDYRYTIHSVETVCSYDEDGCELLIEPKTVLEQLMCNAAGGMPKEIKGPCRREGGAPL
jgi:hypothetical protein